MGRSLGLASPTVRSGGDALFPMGKVERGCPRLEPPGNPVRDRNSRAGISRGMSALWVCCRKPLQAVRGSGHGQETETGYEDTRGFTTVNPYRTTVARDRCERETGGCIGIPPELALACLLDSARVFTPGQCWTTASRRRSRSSGRGVALRCDATRLLFPQPSTLNPFTGRTGRGIARRT